MADFVNGLKSASDYINNTNINIPTNITGDIGTGAITAQMSSFSVKEIVCGILAGNGFKLPNIQICLKINLARLLPFLPPALDALKGAIGMAMEALDNFIAHTGIDALLERLNGVISDFAAIANMINFCGTPVVPRPIPNVLRDMMGSYAGAGMDILNGLGQIAESDIGGCIGLQGKPNFGIFQGGAIKDIGDLIDDVIDGSVANLDDRISSINSQINNFTRDIEELITFENNYAGRTVEPVAHSKGGSTFAPVTRIHTGVGTQIPNDVSFSEASRMAGSLQSAYNQLSQYVIDDQGQNVFDYILEPELIAKLEQNAAPAPVITEQQPVYDYCGKVIGYTTSVVTGNTDLSSGEPVQDSVQPGSIDSEVVDQTATITALQEQIAELTARLDALENP